MPPGQGSAQPPPVRRPGQPSPWEPLRQPLFRTFWIASLFSNLGTWVHEVGAAWLMTTLDSSPLMVSAVRTSMALPMLLLALPAGVLADRVDRRRLLIATQCGLLVVAFTLAGLTYTGAIGPLGLLVLTALTGVGMVVHAPTWQAVIPEIVPRRSIPAAVSLGSVSFNLARSVGPAAGGVIVAAFGSWAAFGLNGLSFFVIITVLLLWRRATPEGPPPEKSAGAALLTGLRFVVGTPTMRHVLARNILFVVPASSLWSLLPLVARNHLNWEARGFGSMVTLIGAGAVLAAAVLPRLRNRFGSDSVIVATGIIAAGCLAAVAVAKRPWIDLPLMIPLGAAWMMTLTTLNATAQMTLPSHLRARGMSAYLSVFAGSMAAGSLLWGSIARTSDVSTALLAAAALMGVTAIGGHFFSIGTSLTEVE